MSAENERLRIWLVKVSEPMPGSTMRLGRVGQLAERLVAKGADVTWWMSDFNHAEKHYEKIEDLVGPDRSARLATGILARFLHGQAYTRNVSIARIRNHRQEARDFLRKARNLPPPHAIFTCYPTIELSLAAVNYGAEHGIPVIVDVRDLWPDVFVDVSPVPAWLGKLALTPLDRDGQRALANATSITAISPPILDWALAKAGRARRATDRVVPLAYSPVVLSAAALAAEERAWRARGLKLDGSEHIACFFGNLSSTPELDTAVDSIDHLPEAIRRNARVVICGGGDKLEWLREQAATRPELLAPGFISAAAIGTLMRHATAGLMIYPSRGDLMISYPNKLGEYLSGLLPVISTVDGITGRLLRDEGCGFVVPNRDPGSLAQAFTALVEDCATRTRMSQAAGKLFTSMFDAGQVYDRLASYLLEVASGRRPG